MLCFLNYHMLMQDYNRYAVERTASFIKVWFWARNDASVPADVLAGNSAVQTDAWVSQDCSFVQFYSLTPVRALLSLISPAPLATWTSSLVDLTTSSSIVTRLSRVIFLH